MFWVVSVCELVAWVCILGVDCAGFCVGVVLIWVWVVQCFLDCFLVLCLLLCLLLYCLC